MLSTEATNGITDTIWDQGPWDPRYFLEKMSRDFISIRMGNFIVNMIIYLLLVCVNIDPMHED